MGERVLNGDFADGLNGWNPQCNCPAGFWYIYVEYEGGDPQPVYCTVETLAESCSASIEQSVDLTGVEKITFDVCPGIDDYYEPLGWGKMWIDDVEAVEWNTYEWDWIHNEIGVSSWTGIHLIKFEVYGGGFDCGLQLANISALGPDEPPPPVANFTAVQTTGFTPLEVQFVDMSTNDPTYWIWDFDDGWAVGVKNPIHVYKKSGAYSPTLTAVNDSGSDTITKWSFILVAWTVERFHPMETIQIGPDPGTEPIVLPLPPCWIDGDPPP